ncbi:MAG: NADP-dependent malic enzyme [Rickettsiales bacterium]
MSDNSNAKVTVKEALEFHAKEPRGKLSVSATKPLLTQRHLSLAYSPGVAYPCEEINKNPETAYKYTAKGNFVAVISNGTAVLGLGNLGALASKPVMEGKAVLFKKFADIDGVDIEVSTEDPDEFINCVKYLGASWGGINLEDIKSPECFIIEDRLKKELDIPVFHDDQHGTAIITLAGLINAAHLTKKDFKKLKIVSSGAGAASIACIELIKKMGVPDQNIVLVDSKGVIYKGRKESMNPWKEKHAVNTKARTLSDSLVEADVFLGLSVKDLLKPEMIKKMAKNPIIFAMANPDPEIKPELAKKARPDSIIATGRSDYPNQVNNVMGFPYIFRGALDVRAKSINDEMKIAAATSLAELARAAVPPQVSAAYGGKKLRFGPEYIIPVPFDPRLIYTIPVAVAKAAMETGVAREPIEDFEKYKSELNKRLNPESNIFNNVFERAQKKNKRIIFADGEDKNIILSAIAIRDNHLGHPILVGREEKVYEVVKSIDKNETLKNIEIANAKISKKVDEYIKCLYSKMQRKGLLERDCIRLVKNDRNVFSACMLECGDGDALIAGQTRNYKNTLRDIKMIVGKNKNEEIFGLSILVGKDKTTLIADSTVNISPTSEQLATFAKLSARKLREFGHNPRVAFVSFSNFGITQDHQPTQNIRDAVKILDSEKVDFEYDGEMSADTALDPSMRDLYPFCRLSGPANILITPSLESAHISSKMITQLSDISFVGPILQGFAKPVQVVHTKATIEEIINMAAIAASDA